MIQKFNAFPKDCNVRSKPGKHSAPSRLQVGSYDGLPDELRHMIAQFFDVGYFLKALLHHRSMNTFLDKLRFYCKLESDNDAMDYFWVVQCFEIMPCLLPILTKMFCLSPNPSLNPSYEVQRDRLVRQAVNALKLVASAFLRSRAGLVAAINEGSLKLEPKDLRRSPALCLLASVNNFDKLYLPGFYLPETRLISNLVNLTVLDLLWIWSR